MKKTLGALAAVLRALVLLSPPAAAHCWWNGYRWHCTHYRHHYIGYRSGYPYYPYAYYPYYRPYYVCSPAWPICWWG
jgi:hypothetical protein